MLVRGCADIHEFDKHGRFMIRWAAIASGIVMHGIAIVKKTYGEMSRGEFSGAGAA
jgi:hypothetical protein